MHHTDNRATVRNRLLLQVLLLQMLSFGAPTDVRVFRAYFRSHKLGTQQNTTREAQWARKRRHHLQNDCTHRYFALQPMLRPPFCASQSTN